MLTPKKSSGWEIVTMSSSTAAGTASPKSRFPSSG